MSRRLVADPFDGTPPAVKPGDLVWCRCSGGAWVRNLAMSEPRYDRPNALGGTVWLSVRVASLRNAYRRDGRIGWHGTISTCNWPAKDVLPNSATPPGPLWREPEGLE